MPSDFWGWIGFIIIVSSGLVGVGAVLVIGLFHWWHERFGIFFKNRNEYIEFTKWRQANEIKTPHDKEDDDDIVGVEVMRFIPPDIDDDDDDSGPISFDLPASKGEEPWKP